jgi:hypothetical protein
MVILLYGIICLDLSKTNRQKPPKASESSLGGFLSVPLVTPFHTALPKVEGKVDGFTEL